MKMDEEYNLSQDGGRAIYEEKRRRRKERADDNASSFATNKPPQPDDHPSSESPMGIAAHTKHTEGQESAGREAKPDEPRFIVTGVPVTDVSRTNNSPQYQSDLEKAEEALANQIQAHRTQNFQRASDYSKQYNFHMETHIHNGWKGRMK